MTKPADDLTRGKTLVELAAPSFWIESPVVLRSPSHEWPPAPQVTHPTDHSELKQTLCCLKQTHPLTPLLDSAQFENWADLLKAAHQLLHGAAKGEFSPPSDLQEAKVYVLKISQEESFPEEVRHLRAGKPVSPSSKLCQLAPEMDPESGLVRVGG